MYDALDPKERQAARRLLLRLVTVGEGGEAVRRMVSEDELTAVPRMWRSGAWWINGLSPPTRGSSRSLVKHSYALGTCYAHDWSRTATGCACFTTSSRRTDVARRQPDPRAPADHSRGHGVGAAE
ncbi:hypothetical protein [Streptomyces collinus]|uniref:hypothetical protein n=1 Tax=Streptomyces collinus TaxID=42684 RepID=UPI003678C89D